MTLPTSTVTGSPTVETKSSPGHKPWEEIAGCTTVKSQSRYRGVTGGGAGHSHFLNSDGAGVGGLGEEEGEQ